MATLLGLTGLESKRHTHRVSIFPTRLDVLLIILLMTVGLAFRSLYFSGIGLLDDPIFVGNVRMLLDNARLTGDNVSFRLAWLLPTALCVRLFGPSEVAFLLPIIAASVLGIGLMYALGKTLFGRPGAVIASLLLIATPLDVAWSTMITPDVIASLFMGSTVLFVLRALSCQNPTWRIRFWIVAGVLLWLAVLAKITSVLVVPVLVLIVLLHWKEFRWHDACDFCLAAGLLLGGTAVAYYLFYGYALAPLRAELTFQGLNNQNEIDVHLVTMSKMMAFPRLLFGQHNLGDFMFSFVPHLAVVLLLLTPLLRIRVPPEPLLWLLVVFLGMEFNVQRIGGHWVTGFRSVRHAHVFVYPLVLLLAGQLASLRLARPRLTHITVCLLLTAAVCHSIQTASKTHDCFDDKRSALTVLATLPKDTIYPDAQLGYFMSYPFGEPFKSWTVKGLSGTSPAEHQKQVAQISHGYLVTGGGREPYYGISEYVISASELPRGRFELLHELPGPKHPTPWRSEPLRIWRARPKAVAEVP